MGEEIKDDPNIERVIDFSKKLKGELIKHRIKKILIISGIIIGIILFLYFLNTYTKRNPIDLNKIVNDTKTQLKINNTKPSQPASNSTKNPKLKCIENWTCGDWESCKDKLLIRKCTDFNKCGTNTTRPPYKKECCNWTCESWSECYPTKFQYRKCTIPEDCPADENPGTKRICNYTSPCKDTEGNGITNYSKKGILTDRSGIKWEDNCKDNLGLIEFYCDKYGTTITREHQCEIQCLDGACLNESN